MIGDLFTRATNAWVSENLAEKVKSPRVTLRPTLPFTHDDMVKILAACEARLQVVQSQGRDNARRLRALVLLLRYSGLRIGDAASCSTERLSDGKLRLYTQKNEDPCPLSAARFCREGTRRNPPNQRSLLVLERPWQ